MFHNYLSAVVTVFECILYTYTVRAAHTGAGARIKSQSHIKDKYALGQHTFLLNKNAAAAGASGGKMKWAVFC